MAESLFRISAYVAERGLIVGGPYQAARDLLLNAAPRTAGQPLHRDSETAVEAAVRICKDLGGGILPIQGPPGAGKTFTGAQMICELVRQGRTVGITANGHKVIRNLIDAAIEAAEKQGLDLLCCQKPAEMEEAQPRLAFARSNKDLFAALGNTAMVGAGTPWVWAAPEAFEIVDVLRARRLGDEIAPRSVAQQLRYCAAARRRVALTPPRSAGWRCRSSNQRRNASHKYHRSVVRKAGRKSSGVPRPPR